MVVRQRALVTAQMPAWTRLQPVVAPLMDTIHAQRPDEAFNTLEHGRIDLIICTLAFDDSRMLEFLQAVKRTAFASIPFICCRATRGVLSDTLVEHMRAACVQCGADALVDIAKLNDEDARSALESAVTASLLRK